MLARGRGLVKGDHVRKHRFILFAVAACFVLDAPAGSAASSGWLDDYHKAQEEAKTNHKLLLLNFTGSDWCGWCIRLDQDVFSQSDFKDYASKNLVVLELDFPRPGGSRWQRAENLAVRGVPARRGPYRATGKIAQRLNTRFLPRRKKSFLFFISVTPCVGGALC